MKYLIFNGDAPITNEAFVRIMNSNISPTVGESSFVPTPEGYEGDFTIKEISYWPSKETVLKSLGVDPKNITLAEIVIAEDVDAIIWIGQQN